MGDAWQGMEAFEEVFPDNQSRAMLENILGTESGQSAKVYPMPAERRFVTRRLVAAVLLVCMGLAAVVYLMNSSAASEEQVAVTVAPTTANTAQIFPGGEKAYLTLADGSVIVLDTAGNGMVTMQGSSKVMKVDDRLVYDGGTAAGAPLVYNTISTPRGGEYRIVLSDGTRVWLNAASSLRFPSAFTGADRSVSLTGEAYFEVSKNTGKPFKVELNNEMEIEVLGTSFNVMAYEDEQAVKTTLVEGKVKMSRSGQNVQLLPNQQAITEREGTDIRVAPADVEEAIAWKEGLFYFNNDNILSIMRKLSRWYNVEVHYSGPVPGGHYEGTIRRQAEIGQVLAMLELPGGINFEINENSIMVRSN